MLLLVSHMNEIHIVLINRKCNGAIMCRFIFWVSVCASHPSISDTYAHWDNNQDAPTSIKSVHVDLFNYDLFLISLMRLIYHCYPR